MIRPLENPNLSWLSSSKETQSTPEIDAISPGVGDPGGVSYGLFQFNTRDGIAEDFAKTLPPPFDGIFAKTKKSDTPEFDAAWRAAAALDPSKFALLQYDFAKEKYYNPAVSSLKSKTGFDAAAGHWTIQEVLWSTSVQHGPGGLRSILDDAIRTPGFPKSSDRYLPQLPPTKQEEYARQQSMIRIIYGERLRRAGGVRGLIDRFNEEEATALEMLRQEYAGANW